MTLRPSQLAWLFACLAAQGMLPVARAQAHDDEVEEDAAPVLVQQNMFVYNEEHFNSWVFNGAGGDANGVRNRFQSLLTLRIDYIDKVCGLSEVQKKKLHLAGDGDIKRFFDRVDEKRQKFLSVKRDQNNINEIFQEIQPLQQEMQAERFGDGSIFFKALKKTLKPDQVAKYEQAEEAKHRFRYRAKVDLAVAILDNAIGLSADQRTRLVKMISEETDVPRRFGQYDYYLVWYMASRLPEKRLKPLFDDKQWTVVTRQIQQARSMEQFLKQNGYLHDDGKSAPAPAQGKDMMKVRVEAKK
jgi:hypothetical protein